MGVIFQTRPGHVVRLNDGGAACTVRLLTTVDPHFDGPALRAIVTRVTLDESVNLQALHTLGNQVFVYVFGDRVGALALSGLAFACDCDDGTKAGADQVLHWWRDNRATRRPLPCRVLIGTTPVDGLMTRFTEDVVDPTTDLVQWGVQLLTLPADDAAQPDGFLGAAATAPGGGPAPGDGGVGPLDWPPLAPAFGADGGGLDGL